MYIRTHARFRHGKGVRVFVCIENLIVCMQKRFECIATAFDPSPNEYIFKGFNNNNKSGKEEPVAVDLNTDLHERCVRFKYIHIETEHCYNYYYFYYFVDSIHIFAILFISHTLL